MHDRHKISCVAPDWFRAFSIHRPLDCLVHDLIDKVRVAIDQEQQHPGGHIRGAKTLFPGPNSLNAEAVAPGERSLRNPAAAHHLPEPLPDRRHVDFRRQPRRCRRLRGHTTEPGSLDPPRALSLVLKIIHTARRF